MAQNVDHVIPVCRPDLKGNENKAVFRIEKCI